MGTRKHAPLTPVQHLHTARTLLLVIHAGLMQFGQAADEDPKALERIEISLQHIGAALTALSAHADPRGFEDEAVPF